MALRPLARLYRLPSRSYFLFGLRGVGKSTWIREQLPEAHRFDLLDEALGRGAGAEPAGLRPLPADRGAPPRPGGQRRGHRARRGGRAHHGARVPGDPGALLEGWIHTLLQTYMAERELGDELAYWAPAESSGVEVDFLVRRGPELCALEVKTARRFQRQHLAGLRALAPLPELRRRVLIYRGDRALRTEDGIDVWPVPTFVEAVAAGGLWP